MVAHVLYGKPKGIRTVKLLEAFHITPTIFLQIYLQTSVRKDSESSNWKSKTNYINAYFY